MNDRIVLLSLDLATVTGWAMLSQAGRVRSGTVSFACTGAEGPGARYMKYRHWLGGKLDAAHPGMVCYERVNFHSSTLAAHVFGGLQGILQAECLVRGIRCENVTVWEVKDEAMRDAAVKVRRPSKAEMIARAREQWPDQVILDDNQADALWILECGRRRFL